MNTLIIRGKIITPTQVIFPGELTISQGKITKVGEPASSSPKQEEVLDFEDAPVLPGFVDIHLHGLGQYGPTGRDILGIASLEPQYGTTAFLPSLGSATQQEFLSFLEDIRKTMADREPGQARVLGAHLEGPYINPLMKGGMDGEYLCLPDPQEYKELIERGGTRLKMMTLSPELPGSVDLIKALRENGTVASLGHSAATADDLKKTVEAGLSHVCHLFNAFPRPEEKELGVREPSLTELCLITEGLTVEIISDMVHVHPAMVQLVLKVKGEENIVSITDSMAGTGLPDGIYKMSDGREFSTRKDDVARLTSGSKVIVGSILTMNYALRNLVKKCGLSLIQASKFTSLNPARVMGLGEEIGSLEVGKSADLTVLNSDFDCLLTLIKGRVAYRKR